MKAIFTFFLSVGMLAKCYAQCSATIRHDFIGPSVSAFSADNFTGDTANTTFLWNFCTGDTASGQVVIPAVLGINMPPNNFCEVCLTISDNIVGCTYTACDTFTSTGNPPTGNCSAYATFTNQDTLYTFFASTLGGQPAVYEWTVNGNLVDTTPSFTTVLYPASYPNGANICVSVTDASGCVATDCIGVGVGNNPSGGFVPCQAYFVIYPDTGANSGGVPGNYYGFNLSTGNYGGNVLWDFGDDSTSTDPYPVHTYATPGNYILCLTVGTAGTSCYDTYCDSSFYAFKTEQNPMSRLTITAPTSIREADSKLQVNLFPNPVGTELNLSVNVETARVTDLLGREVLIFNTTTNKLDVSRLPQGMYVLEGSAGNRSFRTTFIKGL